MGRAAYLAWAKARAQEYVDQGDNANAFASMASDLSKHPDTEGHPGVGLGMMQMMGGGFGTEQQMREFIDGFN